MFHGSRISKFDLWWNHGAEIICHAKCRWYRITKLSCKENGINCDFFAIGDDAEKVVNSFESHITITHGIDFTKESLTQFIVSPTILCPYCNSKFDSKELLSTHIDQIHHSSEFIEVDSW